MKGYMSNLSRIFAGMDAKQLSPLVLAYIGDAVFECYVRARIVRENSQQPMEKLHRMSVALVNATSQSNIIRKLWDYLDEDEQAVVKKGRNAKSGAPPKSAAAINYRYATGFEALIGYLIVEGHTDRLIELLDMAFGQISDK